ncbi:aldehyde dehydrogenase [Arthrobacter sp. zg-ZUI100]|uniref:aldehyde dehydrogenase family protein n=1 Tax=Arthrobacter jiangjiafuii TaxID=2817475 RepID=UPI001AED8E11|nr:aldehyde dehydrogenase family protein [Arthrobacter jiangjiafuii]MBP3037471.1 aldehyde dehydrogenase [Arthrobacter jiangjiafuii]
MSLHHFPAGEARTVPHWINGAAVESEADGSLEIINPRTDAVVGLSAAGTAENVARAVAAALLAQKAWSRTSALVRSEKLNRLAGLILENAAELAAFEAQETGKPAGGALAEIRAAAQYFSYYGGMAPALMGETIDMGDGYHSYTRREAYGVVGVITPWNAPLNQAARAAAPALAAGNAVVIKPSEFTPTTTFQLGVLARQAGLPDGLVNIVNGSGPSVGEAIITHRRVSKVAFTGSVKTGQAIGALAARRVLPLSLELGGKSANIVFEDADLEEAAAVSARAFLGNSGQACSAGTRILVQKAVHDEFVPLLMGAVRKFAEEQDMGPLTTRAQFQKVRDLLDADVTDGVAKHEAPLPGESTAGLFISPVVFTGVDNAMPIARDEVFGPVGVVIAFDDESEAVSIANDSDYGLAGAVWTRDLDRAHRVAREIESGQVYINTYLGPTIDLPFGGCKMSGYGREKGFEALLHYTHTKAIAVKLQGSVPEWN